MGEQQICHAYQNQRRYGQQGAGQLDVVRGFRLVTQFGAITLASPQRFAQLPAQIKHADTEHEQAADQPQPGRGPGGGVEEGGGDDVLDLRRAGQGVHGEAERAEGDSRRNQALGDVALAEHLGRERVHREHHHEQRHAAVGEQGADQHDHQHRLAGAEYADGGRHDGTREPGQLDQFAEYGTEQEHRKIQLDEAHHLFHEHPGEGGRHGAGVGEQHRTEGGDGSEEDDAVATVGGEHQ